MGAFHCLTYVLVMCMFLDDFLVQFFFLNILRNRNESKTEFDFFNLSIRILLDKLS